jgi:hypothetical protein
LSDIRASGIDKAVISLLKAIWQQRDAEEEAWEAFQHERVADFAKARSKRLVLSPDGI